MQQPYHEETPCNDILVDVDGREPGRTDCVAGGAACCRRYRRGHELNFDAEGSCICAVPEGADGSRETPLRQTRKGTFTWTGGGLPVGGIQHEPLAGGEKFGP